MDHPSFNLKLKCLWIMFVYVIPYTYENPNDYIVTSMTWKINFYIL